MSPREVQRTTSSRAHQAKCATTIALCDNIESWCFTVELLRENTIIVDGEEVNFVIFVIVMIHDTTMLYVVARMRMRATQHVDVLACTYYELWVATRIFFRDL